MFRYAPTGTISARVPDDLEQELEAYLEGEHLDRSTAVRKLLAEGLKQWGQDQALRTLEAGDVSFTRAAEIAEMTVWDFAQLATEREVTWVGDDHLAEDIESL